MYKLLPCIRGAQTEKCRRPTEEYREAYCTVKNDMKVGLHDVHGTQNVSPPLVKRGNDKPSRFHEELLNPNEDIV